jgi:hypothetical protein
VAAKMTDKPSLLTRRRVLVAALAFLFSWYAGSYWRGVTMAAEEEREARPWERAEQARRDALPHRGAQLLLLATIGMVCGFFSCCLVLPCFVGLALSVVTLTMARNDLGKMRVGLMDHRGLRQTDQAENWAIVGLFLNGTFVISIVLWIVMSVLP